MATKKKVKKQSGSSLREIIDRGDKNELRALFSFDTTDTEQEILLKFNLWARYYFPKFFKHGDAPFHKDIDTYNYRVYRNEDVKFFVDIVFRGGAKTTRTKLFLAFCIANDQDHFRKYIKILTKDNANAKQVVTDIYNMLVFISGHYPEIFQKTDFKKEERMDSFTTFTGVKMRAGTVGTDQRGQLQEDARPDLIWFDDFETRKTLRSAVETKAIWDNMEEAKTGLSKTGGCIYTCNYLSERGNVHRLVEKKDNPQTKVLIVPIKKDSKPTWNYFSIEDINAIERDADDFAGEYLCEPSAGLDIFFDRTVLEKQSTIEPIRIISEFKIFYEYNPSHRYGAGADVAGGVGLDSSTSCFIDFSTVPNKVVATFKSNTIKPDIFGDELASQGNRFGACIIAPENNKFDMAIGRLKQIYDNIYFTQAREAKAGLETRPKTYGWNTNAMSKPKMLMDLRSAVVDGLLELTDADLKAELMAYTRDDLMDAEDDPRLSTRHFDLLTSCFVKGTMILTDKGNKPIEEIRIGDNVMTRKGFRPVTATVSHMKPITHNIGLTGTPDHPVFCNNNEIKNLSGIGIGDILYIWNEKKRSIERLSYTEALSILDTQTRNIDNIGYISWVVQNGKSLVSTCIDKYGKIITGTSLKDLLYITKMAIHSIISFLIYSFWIIKRICTFICKSPIGLLNYESLSKRIELKLTKLYGKAYLLGGRLQKTANCALESLRLLPIMPSFALSNVGIWLQMKDGKSHFLKKDVLSATKDLIQESHTRKDVRQSVLKIDEESNTKNNQEVFNITVGETPEYFANGVLVHNCAIAWQMRNYATIEEAIDTYQQPSEYESPLIG